MRKWCVCGWRSGSVEGRLNAWLCGSSVEALRIVIAACSDLKLAAFDVYIYIHIHKLLAHSIEKQICTRSSWQASLALCNSPVHSPSRPSWPFSSLLPPQHELRT